MRGLTTHHTELLILTFLIITYGISLIEKFADWKGTVAYIRETFENTFVSSFIKPLLAILVFLETITLFFLTVGLFQLFRGNENENALIGCTYSCYTILYMLIGQRVAKDYQGATSLAVYFLISVFGVYILV